MTSGQEGRVALFETPTMPDGDSNETARYVGNVQRQAWGGGVRKVYVYKNKQRAVTRKIRKDRPVMVAV